MHKFVCFQMPNKRLQLTKILKGFGLKSFNIWVRNYLFPKNYLTSEGAVSQNVLCYKQLSIAYYQVSFHANSYFEYLPSAFKSLINFTNSYF